MVEIKIQDKSYEIPTEWKDITLRYWCGLYSIINQYNKRDDDGNVIEAEHSEVELLKMNRDIFIYLTGVSHNEMNMLDVDSVNNAVAIFSQTLEEYKPKGIDKCEFEGEEYLFPKEFLRRNIKGSKQLAIGVRKRQSVNCSKKCSKDHKRGKTAAIKSTSKGEKE